MILALLLASAGAAAPSGRVAGKVAIAGLAPKLAPLPVTRDPKHCGVNKPDEALVIGVGGGVKNTILWIAGAPPPKEPEKLRVRLDQQACRFEPHVLALPAGAFMDIVNSDAVIHHVQGQVGEEKQFSYPMPLKGYVIGRQLKKAEVLRLTCTVHPWMKAFVKVLDSGAYAVTDAEGRYALEGVPPGKHKLKLWHERLGEREEEIEVAAGQTAARDITLPPR